MASTMPKYLKYANEVDSYASLIEGLEAPSRPLSSGCTPWKPPSGVYCPLSVRPAQ